jgi:type IV conjugative transfer system coupling protein TraD
MPIFNSKSSDFSRGADTTLHSIRMLFRSAAILSIVTLLLAVFITMVVAWSRTDDVDREVGWRSGYAYVMSEMLHQDQALVTWNTGEETYRIPASRWLANSWVREHTQHVVTSLTDGWAFGSAVGTAGLFIAIVFFMVRGRNLRAEKLIRGARIVRASVLAWQLFWRRQASDIKLGKVPLIKGSETQTICISGTTGSGKTQLLCSIFEMVRSRNEAAVVYDPTGEFVRAFYREGDTILSPIDGRSPVWLPWSEIQHPSDALRIAKSIIQLPVRSSADPFWPISGQHTLAALLLRLMPRPDRSISLLLKTLSESSPADIAELLKGTPIGAIFAGSQDHENRLARSVLGTLLPYIECLQFLPAGTAAGGTFAIRDWVEKIDQTSGPKPWLFISSRADSHEATKPLISCWLDCFAASLMSLPPDRKRRLFFVIDELPSLQRLPSVPRLLAEGRKFGAACVLAMQGIPQLRAVYGADEAEAMVGLCNTHVVFRTNSPDTARWASNLLGEREIEEAKEAMTYSASNVRDGIHLSENRHTRPIVLPTEVMQLEPLHFYVKLAGNYPIAKTKIVPRDRPDMAPPYVEADIGKTAWASFWPAENPDTSIEQTVKPISFDQPTKPSAE